MCFVTMAGLSAGMAVAGGALKAVGSISQGYAAAANARRAQNMQYYQAQVARQNAEIAEQNAVRAEQSAGITAANKSMEVGARVARIRTAQAASGVNVNTGSAVDVQASTRMLGKQDTDTVFANEMLKVYGYRNQARGFETEAGMDVYRGNVAGQRSGDYITSGYLQAGGDLMSSLSSLPTKWGGETTGGNTGPTGKSYADELAAGERPV